MPEIGSISFDNLFAGNVQPVVTEEVTIAAEQSLQRGQIVELDASNNVIAPADTVDPADAYGVMSENVETGTGENKKSVIYLTGEFNQNKIIFPDGFGITDYREPLRKLGIFLKPTVQE